MENNIVAQNSADMDFLNSLKEDLTPQNDTVYLTIKNKNEEKGFPRFGFYRISEDNIMLFGNQVCGTIKSVFFKTKEYIKKSDNQPFRVETIYMKLQTQKYERPVVLCYNITAGTGAFQLMYSLMQDNIQPNQYFHCVLRTDKDKNYINTYGKAFVKHPNFHSKVAKKDGGMIHTYRYNGQEFVIETKPKKGTPGRFVLTEASEETSDTLYNILKKDVAYKFREIGQTPVDVETVPSLPDANLDLENITI